MMLTEVKEKSTISPVARLLAPVLLESKVDEIVDMSVISGRI
jgi:hypothetical protein